MQFVRRAVQSGGMVPWVALWTVLFVLVNRAPILGRAMPIWDARDSFFPFYVLTADHIRAGRIVSWDVWSNAGLPRLGDPEFGAVWPLQLLVGVIFGGTPMGFIATLGIIALAGMIIRNSVILVVQIDQDLQAGATLWNAIVESAVRRMRPIILTALAAILAMVPLTRSVFWGPMAWSIMGGLFVATLLTLLFLPALYASWYRATPISRSHRES